MVSEVKLLVMQVIFKSIIGRKSTVTKNMLRTHSRLLPFTRKLYTKI